MALTKVSLVDLNAGELILDLDADTSITSDTDDTIHFKIGGSDEITITGTALSPSTSDGNALGTAALEWSDLFLADGAVINFGDDQDVSLTHVADSGLLLSSTDKLMFNDASQFIQGVSATVLDIAATDEIELTSTLIDVVGNLAVSGTIVGAGALTAATSITVGSAVLTEAELETLDGVTVGTAIASKVVTTDANIDTTGQRNLTITGELDAATGDFSGDVDIDGTANLDVVDIDGATQIDATVTVGVDDTGYDVKFFGDTSGAHMLWDASVDDLILAGAGRLVVPEGNLVLGSTAVTSTPAEINLIDGGATVGTTAVADGDGLLHNDNGTMRVTSAATFKTYMMAGTLTTAAQTNITSLGTLTALTVDNMAFNGNTLTTTGTLIIDSDTDITLDAAGGAIAFKDAGTDQLTLDMDGTAGAQVIQLRVDADDLIFKQFDGTVVLTLDDDTTVKVATDLTVGDDVGLISDGAVLTFGANSEVTLTHVHNDGLLLNADMQLQFRDSAINIRSDADGDLDINADDEIELNSTLIDINGNVEISGTLTQTGIATFPAIPVFSAGINVSGGTIAGTLATAAQTNITSVGTLTALAVDNITIDANTISTTNTNGALDLTPNGTGNINLNTDKVEIIAAEGESSTLTFITDEGDDNGDVWSFIHNTDNTFSISTNASGSNANHLILTGHATATSSSTRFLGGIRVDDNIVMGTDGKGIDFSANADSSATGASTTAEILDDYEEGTWTPVLTDGSNDATMHALTGGVYTKIGRMVQFSANVRTSSLGSVSGNINVKGLPFAAANTNGNHSAVATSNAENMAITADTSIHGYISKNGATVRLDSFDDAGGVTVLQASEFSADGQIVIGGTYSTA